MRQDRRRGATIIELLVVLGILGIVTTVAIWNYFIAVERAKAKRTVSDMRSIGVAWQAREADRGNYNAAGALFTWPAKTVAHDEMVTNLSPTWIRVVPRLDGWGRPLEFGLDQPFGSGVANVYAIRSRGRDGIVDPNYDTTPTDEFDCDIVYSNGTFVVYPQKAD